MNIVKILIIVFIVLSVSGCGGTRHQIHMAINDNDTEEVMNLIKREDFSYIGFMQRTPNSRAIDLCKVISDMKQYKELFSCIKTFKQVAKGARYHAKSLGEVNLLLAQAYFEIGDYRSVIKVSENTRKLVEHPEYAKQQDRLFAAVLTLGMTEIAAEGRSFIHKAKLYYLLSHSYILIGDVTEGKKYLGFLESLDKDVYYAVTYRDTHLTNLAKLYYELNNFQKSYDILNSDGLNFNELVFNTLITGLNFMSYAYGEAFFLKHDRAAIVEWEKNSQMILMLAETALKLNKYDESKEYFKKLLDNPVVKIYMEVYARSLHGYGNVLIKQGKISHGTEYLQKAIEAREKSRSSLTSEAYRISFIGNKQNLYSDIINSLITSNKEQSAFEYAERAKSRALVDTLASKKQFGNQSNHRSNQLLADLDKAELESLQLASNTSRTRSIEIQQKIETTDKQLSSLITVKSPNVVDIQSKLKKDEVLVEYYGNDKDYFIFVLTKNSIKSVKIDSSKLESLVTTYRAALSTRDSKKYKSASKALYNVVIKPVKHLIKGKQLTVVPHGSLHYVPFASLWDGRRYLVQNHQIRTLPSASVLEFLQKKVENKAGNLLILGNPDLGDPQYDLPAAQEESLRLAKRVKGSKVLLRKKATETALKKYGSSFKNIHFAMHGLFEAEKPLTSGLFLAPDSENDGRLTVSELYDLELNADLVTLSACETALGETKSGDDVIGFTRGFLYAGANSIVSSLWEVDDEATRDLMLRFYRELKSNNKARALQKAQLRVMKKYPHPYYWAAFQLTGQY
jgi:CHAT domain-containing protein